MIPGIIAQQAGVEESDSDPIRSKRHLILYGEGADESTSFVDHSPFAFALTPAGAAKNDVDVDVNGTPSINLGAANANRIVFSPAANFSTGTKDVCFEAYIRLTSVGAMQTIIQRRAASVVDFWCYVSATGKLTWGWYAVGTQRLLLAGATTLAINTTYHVCMIRKSGVTYLFINGVLDATGTQSGNESSSSGNDVSIGYDPTNTGRYLRGAFNWMRFTIDDAVYNPAGFTPDSVPYPIV